MSRSYKKHNFGSFVCYKTDKPYRQIYNRVRRRKSKQQINFFKTRIEDFDLYFDLNSSRIDRSCTYADKWSWASDGGVHYLGDKNKLRSEIEQDFFGLEIHQYSKRTQDIWDKYKELQDPKTLKSDWWFLDFLFLKNLIPLDFKNSSDLIDWFRENNEQKLDIWYRYKLRK